MKRIFALLLALAAYAAVMAATYTVETVPNVHLADRTRFVSDPDGILTPAALTEADSILSRVRRSTSAEVVAVIVDDIEGGDIDSFATELYNSWGLGKKDNNNGVLILVARDLRRAVIRTGYGSEGVLPDIICGRILRQRMFPMFREGDYSGGLLAGVSAVADVLTDPQAADELRSSERDADNRRGIDSDSAFSAYLGFCVVLTVALLLWLCVILVRGRGKSRVEKYHLLESFKPISLACTFLGLGMPIVASVPAVLLLNHWRNGRRRCPNCGADMQKIDEVHDNDYLTPAQDMEEKVGSVDYDVWLCPACGETDIIAFPNRHSPMVECDNCHARTAMLATDRILRRPTTSTEGQGVKEYHCMNCRHNMYRRYTIPKEAAAVVPIIIGGGGRGGSGFGGGSFGGGFGGGMTGGGGASGGW